MVLMMVMIDDNDDDDDDDVCDDGDDARADADDAGDGGDVDDAGATLHVISSDKQTKPANSLTMKVSFLGTCHCHSSNQGCSS
jgi:hypothetical protein